MEAAIGLHERGTQPREASEGTRTMNKLNTTGSKNVNVLGAEELEQVVGGWGRRGNNRWGGGRNRGGGGGGQRRNGGGGGGQRRNGGGGGGGGDTFIFLGDVTIVQGDFIDDRDQNDDNIVEISNFGAGA